MKHARTAIRRRPGEERLVEDIDAGRDDPRLRPETGAGGHVIQMPESGQGLCLGTLGGQQLPGGVELTQRFHDRKVLDDFPGLPTTADDDGVGGAASSRSITTSIETPFPERSRGVGPARLPRPSALPRTSGCPALPQLGAVPGRGLLTAGLQQRRAVSSSLAARWNENPPRRCRRGSRPVVSPRGRHHLVRCLRT
jgi:hypothetical protein